MTSFARQVQRRTRERRVVLQRPDGVDHLGSRVSEHSDEASPEASSQWWREWTRGTKSPFKTHPVVRLTEHGIDWGAAPRPGDEVGYGMDPYRTDDCLQAAVATATQVPIEEVPDFALDRRLKRGDNVDEISRTTWERVDGWASKRGLALMYWKGDEVPVPRERWIGVIASSNTGTRTVVDASGRMIRTEGAAFNDHCLVMSHERLVFDPSCSVKVPPGMRMLCCDPAQITYGISFEKEE